MSMERRKFLRSGLLAAGGAAAGALVSGHADVAEPAESNAPAAAATLALTTEGELVVSHAPRGASERPTSDEVRRGVPGRRWVMVIDLANCDGCGVCSMTCSQSHFVPSDRQWLRVFRMQDDPASAPYWMPRPCFHCDDPPCARVCPVGATFKRDDGIVLIDNERCIGCRFCMAACPYSVRTFNWGRPTDPPAAIERGYSPEWGYPRRVGTAEKCDFCPDMARDGKLPHCAGACPMGAIWFGDENEDAVTNSRRETVRLSTLLRNRAAFRELEELGTKPRVYYLPPDNRRYPAPGEPGAQTGNQPQHGTEQR